MIGNPHFQTVWPSLVRRPKVGRTELEIWKTEDGDVLDLEFLPGAGREGRPGILALHGLESSSRAQYIRGALRAADALGWNAAGLNFRSCGPSPHKYPRTYHSGETDDLRYVIARLRERWKGSPLAIIGFSLGANVVLKWLGEEGDAAPVAAAVAVSTPFDLGAAARALDSGGFWSFVYRKRFLRSLHAKIRRALLDHPQAIDPAKLKGAEAWTFAGFDDVVTAPINGFKNADDYWTRSSSAQFVPRIRRPTLIVSSEDDPISPGSTIPRAAIAANPVIRALLTATGGHVGFIEGSLWNPGSIAEREAFAFLAGVPAMR